MKLLTALAILGLFATAGCEPQAANGDTAATQTASTELITGTPDGDLEDWVADMRTGLDSLANNLSTVRAELHRRVLELYVLRQEYLEAYYGPTGKMGPSAALGESVREAEVRWHEVIRLASAAPPAEEPAIRTAIAALDDQLEKVLSLSKESERRVRPVSR